MFAVSLGVCLSSLCRNRGVLRYLKNASMFGHFLRGVGRYGNSGPLLYVYVWTSHIVYCFHHFSDGPRPFVWPVQLWRQTHFNSADVETLPPHTACCVVFPTEDPPGIAGILPGLVGLHTTTVTLSHHDSFLARATPHPPKMSSQEIVEGSPSVSEAPQPRHSFHSGASGTSASTIA